MGAPLIEIRGLTMQFGGLVAVNKLDLAVEADKITSIIGPNGAGKTTLFNCLSGVLSPTSGAVLIDGRDPRRAWTWKTTTACLLVGLATAVLGGGLMLNVNGLWRATIRRPNNFSAQPFTWCAAAEGLVKYLRGELAVERGNAARWNVVTADGSTLLGTCASRTEAADVKNAYDRLRALPANEISVVQVGGKWLLQATEQPAQPTATDSDELLAFASRDSAYDRLNLLVATARDRKTRRQMARLAALSGLLVGSLGMASVWMRWRWTPEVIAAAGIGRTFQNLRLFTNMTSFENVLVALETDRTRVTDAVNEVRRLLEFVSLSAAADRKAGELAYGDRRRLEIARALALRPRLLLLDEPAAGMNAIETERLQELIRQIRDTKISIVLIDHEMTLVMGISDHVIVLANGRKIAAGTPEQIRREPAVIEAYLGQ